MDTNFIIGHLFFPQKERGHRGLDRMDFQLPMQSVPITTNVRPNLAHDEVCSLHHYVIKLDSDLCQFYGFLQFPPPIKLTAII